MAGPPGDHLRAEVAAESLAWAIADLGGSFIVAAGQLPELDPGTSRLAAEGGLFPGDGGGQRPGPGTTDPGNRSPQRPDRRTSMSAEAFRRGFADLPGPDRRFDPGPDPPARGRRPAGPGRSGPATAFTVPTCCLN